MDNLQQLLYLDTINEIALICRIDHEFHNEKSQIQEWCTVFEQITKMLDEKQDGQENVIKIILGKEV